jgi:hypothetical protein
MKRILLLMLTAALVVSLISCAPGTPEETPLAPGAIEKLPELEELEEELDIKVTERGVKYIVDPSKLAGGGPPKDGIPSIDDPEFVSVEEADQWIQDDELVLGFIHKGVKRAYPLQVMVWHEITNDVVAGEPVLITY